MFCLWRLAKRRSNVDATRESERWNEQDFLFWKENNHFCVINFPSGWVLFRATATCNLYSHPACSGWQVRAQESPRWHSADWLIKALRNDAQLTLTLKVAALKTCELPSSFCTQSRFFFLFWLAYYESEWNRISLTVQCMSRLTEIITVCLAEVGSNRVQRVC